MRNPTFTFGIASNKILLKVKFQEVPHEEITNFIKNKNSDLIMK